MPNLSTLPRYYTWRDVLALYGDDEDAFMEAWCDGTLPAAIRGGCEESLGQPRIQTWLLRRIVRQQAQIIQLLKEPA